jgi:Ca-activated chloride channel homolog
MSGARGTIAPGGCRKLGAGRGAMLRRAAPDIHVPARARHEEMCMHSTRAGNAWRIAALMSMMFGCGESEVQRLGTDERVEHERRLVRMQSRAAEQSEGEYERSEGADEGRMGKEDRRSSGQYAMKSPDGDAAGSRDQAIQAARSAGILGNLSQGSYSGGTLGQNESSADVSSGLEFGGSGKNTIGTGRYGTIGHGAGSGSGYGRGSRAAYARVYGTASATASGTGGYPGHQQNNESYKDYGINPMIAVAEDKVSTFSIDVDTASYSIARRKIQGGELPPPEAVRVEEFLNYFNYEYPESQGDQPLAVHMDAAPSPFGKPAGKPAGNSVDNNRYLMRVGVQARKLSNRERKPVNLVFLVDVSGSMDSADKIGLAKRSLGILVNNLRDGDSVALVTYAGSVRVVLEPTRLERKGKILDAINSLYAGGSTSMGSGIELAYELAARNLGPGVESRVIVLSDGDANVGNTSHQEILKTISGHVKEGVTLSTIGFGMGNYKDVMMEQLANRGNGNYYYIDDIAQARRVFQEQLGSMLEMVAKDVKIQVEFDAAVVTHYRLIGYENRDIADRDFRDDRVDAGEVGAGHAVTALYEIALAGEARAPLAVVRVRAKEPRGESAREWVHRFDLDHLYPTFAGASRDFRFATAVMGAAEILRQNEYASSLSLSQVIEIAEGAIGKGERDRREFVRVMRKVQPRLAAVARAARK